MPSNSTRNVPRADIGLALDRDERATLEAAGIRISSRVAAIRQESGKTIYRFDEAGGSAGNLGHYAGVLPLAGHPFLLNRRLMSFSGNKEHRRIAGAAFVRFEVLRYRTNYVHAYITLHADGGHHLLFRARYGEIGKDNDVLFPPDTGIEDKVVPSFLMDGFKAALEGARCDHCQCASHFLSVGEVKLPEGLLAALHISTNNRKPEAALAAGEGN